MEATFGVKISEVGITGKYAYSFVLGLSDAAILFIQVATFLESLTLRLNFRKNECRSYELRQRSRIHSVVITPMCTFEKLTAGSRYLYFVYQRFLIPYLSTFVIESQME